jgi:DNA-directed RNA polymerase subunit omega
LENIGNIDSKYRFVILAAKRAKQLLRGAKPKVKTKTRNLIRIAQTEVRSGLIEYDILPTQKDEHQDREDRGFGGDELVVEIAEPEESPGKAAEDEEPEDEEEAEDEESDDDDSDDEPDDDNAKEE